MAAVDQIADTSDEEEEEVVKAPFNPFDLLSDEEGATAEPESAEEAETSDIGSSGKQDHPAAGQTGAAKSKKKSKKKKKAAAQASVDTNGGTPSSKAAKEEESIEQLLVELNIQKGAASDPSTSGQEQHEPEMACPRLLAIDPKKLRGDEELRRIFGSRVVREEERNHAGGADEGLNRRLRRALGRGAIKRKPLKKGWLITPRDHWPRFEGGISMEPLGPAPDGRGQLFRYTFSTAYQGVQALFEECQATYDPNNIAALLAHHPYHVDSLLAMYELHRATGQHEYADELLERCLYALEMAWHPWFNPITNPDCRLKYEENDNRRFFHVLFKHMLGLSRKGLHATAFETAKLMYALDGDDPMGMIFYLDYLALRLHNYAWLKRWEDSKFQGNGNMISAFTMPNLAFSIPLARLRLWQQRKERTDAATARASSSGAPSGSPDDAQDSGELESSMELLAQDVLLHPLAVARLMKRLQEKGVGNDQEWLSILRKPLFARAGDFGSATYLHLVDLFVERQHLLWKVADAQMWLKQACKMATEGPLADRALDYAVALEQAFPVGDDNAYSHLHLSDFSNTVAALPPEELQAVVLGPHRAGGQPGQQQAGQDMAQLEEALALLAEQHRGNAPGQQADREETSKLVLRGMDLIGNNTSYVYNGNEPQGEPRSSPSGMVGGLVEATEPLTSLPPQSALKAPVDEETLRQMHPLQALLQSLLPWVNAGEAPDHAAEDTGEQAGEEGHGMPAEDRERLNEIARQMRAAFDQLQGNHHDQEEDDREGHADRDQE